VRVTPRCVIGSAERSGRLVPGRRR
jgi:hypothetical protein